MENRFIFHPEKTLVETPADLGLEYEEAIFSATDGVQLHGWFIPGTEPFTLLWCHGNAGNISHRLDNIRLLHGLVGVHIFIFDYRAYGRSTGEVSEEGTYRDAEGALGYLRSRSDLDSTRIVYFGRSLGSAVAVNLAAKETPAGLILESPFLSIRAMAKAIFPFLPLGPFLRTRYDSLAKIAQVSCPLLIIHGDQDEIVPYSHGQRLYTAASEPKEFYTIRGAGHNDTYVVGGEEYFAIFRRFLNKLR
jgi:fermentation-respiration switch protein FrsA (DUF1100 family)